MVQIITTVIEAKFALFQVMKKLVGTKAVELLHTTFGKGPEALDAIDMIRADGKLIIAVTNTKMPCKTDIDKAVIAAPPVGMDDDIKSDIAANNGLQRAFFGN